MSAVPLTLLLIVTHLSYTPFFIRIVCPGCAYETAVLISNGLSSVPSPVDLPSADTIIVCPFIPYVLRVTVVSLVTVLSDVILSDAFGLNSALIVLFPTSTGNEILTTSLADTVLVTAFPSALETAERVPAQLGTTVYSYSSAPQVLEEYTLRDGVILSSTTSSDLMPLLALFVNLISDISTDIFLETITPTHTVPSSCTEVKSLTERVCV